MFCFNLPTWYEHGVGERCAVAHHYDSAPDNIMDIKNLKDIDNSEM